MLIFIDDILVFGRSHTEHDDRLQEVLTRLKIFNIELNENKCHFKLKGVNYLGHRISNKIVELTTEKIDAVLNFRVPRSVEEVRSFLGLVNYVSRFIEDVATETFHLREIFKAKKFY